MARRLSAADRVARLLSEGFSRSQIAKAIGYSASTVGRIARGESKGEKALPALREFSGRGKRAKTAIVEGKQKLPSAKPASAPKPKPAPTPAPAPVIVSPLDRAVGQFAALDRGGVEKVVVHITSKKTGRSRTLWAKGGIEPGEIRGNLKGAMLRQAWKQGQNSNTSDPDLDFDEISEIEFEEYY